METEPDFLYDNAVIVSGLVNRQDLNDRAARVCELAPRSDGRIGIQMLLAPDQCVWIRPENLNPIEFSEQVDDPKFSRVTHDEKNDLRMYLEATRGAEGVPGVKAVCVPTAPNDHPLTNEEKAQLLLVGQWGDLTSSEEWRKVHHEIVRVARGGTYPSDWSQQVVEGELFRANGQPTRTALICSSRSQL